MTIVGEASVVLRANDGQLGRDILDGMHGIEGDVESAGNAAGFKYGRALGSNAVSSANSELHGGKIGDDLGKEGEQAGREFGDDFARQLKAFIGDAVRDGLRPAEEESEEEGAKSGKKFSSAFKGGIGSGLTSGVSISLVALVPAITAAVGAIGSLGAGLVAIASYSAQAAPAIALLAPALTGVAAVAGTLLVAFHGLGSALQANTQLNTQGAAAALQYAQAQRNAADAVISAQQGVVSANIALANAQQTQANNAITNAQAVRQAQEQVVTASQQSADSQIADARSVRDANEALALARRREAQQAVSDAQQVAQAEFGLQTAEQSERDAQIALTDARQAAENQIKDLANAVADANLNVQQSQLSLAEAQARYNAVMHNSAATSFQKQEALLALQQAQQGVTDAQQRATEAAQASDTATKRGVDGNTAVVSASEALTNAQHGVQDAVQAVNKALQTQADDSADNSKSVRDAAEAIGTALTKQSEDMRANSIAQQDAANNLANSLRTQTQETADNAVAVQQATIGVSNALRALKNALQDQATQAAIGDTTLRNYNATMSKVAPATQQFAKYLATLKQPFLDLQQAAGSGLFPGLEGAITSVVKGPFFPLLQQALHDTGVAVSGVAQQFADFLNSPQFGAQFKTLFTGNTSIVSAFGTVFVNLAKIFTDIAVAAQPFLLRFAGALDKVTGSMAAFYGSTKGQAKLTTDLNTAFGVLGELFHVLGDVWGLVKNVGEAAAPAGKALLDAFDGAVNKAKEFTGSVSGQNTLKQYFAEIVPNVEAFAHLIGTVILDIAKLGANPSIKTLADDIRTKLLPVALQLGNEIISFAPKLVPIFTNLGTIFSNLFKSGSLQPFLVSIGGIISLLTKLSGNKGVQDLALGIATLVAGSRGLKTVSGGLNDIVNIGRSFRDIPGAIKGTGKATTDFGKALEGIRNGAVAGFGAVKDGAGKLGPAFSKLGPLASKASGLISGGFSLLTNPIGLTIAAVAAVGVGFYELYQHCKPFRDIINDIASFLKTVFLDAFHAVESFFKKFGVDVLVFIAPFIGIPLEIHKHWDAIVDFFKKLWNDISGAVSKGVDAVVDFFTKFPGRALDAIKSLVDKIGDFFSGFFSTISNAVSTGVGDVINFFTGIPDKVVKGISNFADKIGNFLKGFFTDVWNRFSTGVQNIIKFFTDIPQKIVDGLSGFAKKIGDFFGGFFDKVGKDVSKGIEDTVDFFKKIPGKIVDALKGALDFGKNIIDFFEKPFKTIFNWIADAWNNTIGKLSFHLPSFLGGGGFSMPKLPKLMADGGFVNSPTMSVVGEAGPELVLPLSRPNRMNQLLAQAGIVNSGGGQTIVVNNYNPIAEPGSISVTKAVTRLASVGAFR